MNKIFVVGLVVSGLIIVKWWTNRQDRIVGAVTYGCDPATQTWYGNIVDSGYHCVPLDPNPLKQAFNDLFWL